MMIWSLETACATISAKFESIVFEKHSEGSVALLRNQKGRSEVNLAEEIASGPRNARLKAKRRNQNGAKMVKHSKTLCNHFG